MAEFEEVAFVVKRYFTGPLSRRRFMGLLGGSALGALAVGLGYAEGRQRAASVRLSGDYVIINGWVLTADDLDVGRG
jgi:hypothetical protein